MINLIGAIPRGAADINDPCAHLHDYDKTPSPGRKLGHITVVAESAHARDEWLRRLSESVTQSSCRGGHAT